MEVRYVEGPGLAIGAGRRWLLLGGSPSDELVDALFDTVRGTDDLHGVVELLGRDHPELPVAALDTGSRPAVRTCTGAARLDDSAPGSVRMDLGRAVSGTPRRLVSGVARAGELRLTGLGAAGTGALISAVPQEILDAVGPDGPPPRRPRVVPRYDSGPLETADPAPAARPGAEQPLQPLQPASAPTTSTTVPPSAPEPTGHTGDHTGDHTGEGTGRRRVPAATDGADGPARPLQPHAPGVPDAAELNSTVVRSSPPPGADHLHSGEVPTVLAVWCPSGHPTPVAAPTCRVCRAVVAPQQARHVPRPVLGGLRLPTNEVVPLDRGVVVGRRPTPLAGSEEWPHLVHLAPELGFVSRVHLQLELDGWLVLARDLSSRGGTTLTPPGRPTFRMQAQEPYALEPGSVLNLADVYQVRFEVGPEVVG